MLAHIADRRDVDIKVLMDQQVSHSYDAAPSYLRMLVFQLRGHGASRLTNNLQVVQHLDLNEIVGL